MTASALASLLSARRSGRDRWVARCPAHDDRHPSLAIAQGNNAVLLKCWSRGCNIEAICAALSISVRDLFSHRRVTPEQRRRAALDRTDRELQQARQRRRRIALMKGYRACEVRMQEIMTLLAAGDVEGENELANEFHAALAFQRCVEAEVFP